MMYPLLLMLIVHGCAALPPFFGGPLFGRSFFPGPSAFDTWPSSFPSFSTVPSWMNAPSIATPSFPTFTPTIIPFQMPQMPPMPAMPAFPTIPKDPTEHAECQEVSDVSDLTFPPHSEIPTTNLKPEDILKNEVNKTTYLCKDNNKKEFYLLRTHAVFTTANIRNKQDTASYYSLDKSPVIIGKDLSIDQSALWDLIDKLDKQKEVAKPTQTSTQNSYYPNHPYWSSLWSPYSAFGYGQSYQEPTCTDHEFMSNLDYPNVDVSAASIGDAIADKDTVHETKFCTDNVTHKKFYFLKTTVTVKTKNGHTMNRSATISHAADDNGNPLPRADGATSVVSSTISSVNNGIPKTVSSYSTYHHQ